MIKQHRFLALGQLTFVLGFSGFLLNEYYLDSNSFLAFFSGLLFGLSLVLNLTYLIRQRKGI